MRHYIEDKKVIATNELHPVDGRKSFYGKALVHTTEDGAQYLQSYETIVASITANGEFRRHWEGYSATTGRHVRAFMGLNKAEFYSIPCTYR